jgi:hypothetical protein
MSKLDVHKAKIALNEKLFFAALAVLVTLLGWAVSNLVSAPTWMLVSAALTMLVTLAYAIKQFIYLHQLIKELEHVE